MILAFDVYYRDDGAKAVAIAFENWTDNNPRDVHTAYINQVAAYEPGGFYKRELPCLLQILHQRDLATVDLIVVDGYVILDNEGSYGLGGHLYEALAQKIPVIGVAKTNFARNTMNVRKVFRGLSKNPLNVTAIGIDIDIAAENISAMHGDHRMPTLLKLLDTYTRV